MQNILNLLQPGAQFTLSGSPYEVVKVKQDEARVASTRGGPISHFKINALKDLLENGQIEITFIPRNREDGEQQHRSALTQAQNAGLTRRLHYVQGIHKLCPDNPCSQTAIARHIETLASAINDPNPPGSSTIAGWVLQWRKAAFNEVALANKTKPTRAASENLDATVLELVNQAIQSVYLTPNRGRMCDVYAEVQRLIANYNVDTTQPLVTPSAYNVNRIIQRIDLYERDLKRYGKAYAKRRHRVAGRAFSASEPLEVCMADGQIMDVVIIEETIDGSTPKPLGRPFLTAILDLRTRCILAAFISLQPFCGGTVLRAMTDAVVATPGRPRGIMSTLIVDNGCDYQDSGFLRFLSDLGVTLEVCSPRTPNGKAPIERFFRTLNSDLIHKLPGTTFSNPTERGDYRSQDMARLTLNELRGRVQTWIDEIYHQRPHRRLGRAPIDVWNEETGS